MSTEKKRITPYPLRLSPELREELEKSSKENSRSLHAEILHILRMHFDIEKQIIEGVDKKDQRLKIKLKSTFEELFRDFEKDGKVTISKKLDD